MANNDDVTLAQLLAEEEIFQSAVNGMHSFEHTLEQFYWHSSELKKFVSGFLTVQKDMIEALLSNVRASEEVSSKISPEESALEIYVEVINESIIICNRDFAQMFERNHLLPIGQARANFNEVNRLVDDRAPLLVDVKHYVSKIDQLQSNTDMKRVVRNQSKLKASLMTLKNHTTAIWTKLTDLDNFRCKIIWADFTDIIKLTCDLLTNFSHDLSEAHKERATILSAAQDASDPSSIMRRQPSANLAPSNRSMLRYLLKHKNVPDIDKLLADDADFANQYDRFERLVAELPSYTETLKRYRDGVYSLMRALFLVSEDTMSMVNRDDVEAEVRHVVDLKAFFLQAVAEFNREFTVEFDNKFINPVNSVCQGLEEVRTRVDARMTNLMEHDHYKSLAMASTNSNNATKVWDQYSITQEQFNQDNQMLNLRFQQTDAIFCQVTRDVGFQIIEMIRTSVIQKACDGMIHVRNEWRSRQGEVVTNTNHQQLVPVMQHQASLTNFDTMPSSSITSSSNGAGLGPIANMINKQGSLEDRLQNLSSLPTPLQRTIAKRMEKDMKVDEAVVETISFQGKDIVQTNQPKFAPTKAPVIQAPTAEIPGLSFVHVPTVPLTELYEDYTVQLTEESGGYGLGMKLVRKEEISSVTGVVLDWAVVNVIVPRSPAEMMGVRSNSIVMEVNGQSVHGLSFDQVKNLLREASRPVAIRFMYRRVPDIIFTQQLQASVSNYLQMKLPASVSRDVSNAMESQKQYINQATLAQQAQTAYQPPPGNVMPVYYQQPQQAMYQQQQQYAMDAQMTMAQRASQQYQMPLGYQGMMQGQPLTPGPPPFMPGMVGYDGRNLPAQFNYP